MPSDAHGGPSSWGASGASAGSVGGETEEELFWHSKDSQYFSRIHPQLLQLLQQHRQESKAFLDSTVPLLAARARRLQQQQQQQQQQQMVVQTSSLLLSPDDILAIEGEAPLPQAEEEEQKQLLLQLEKLQQQLQQEQQEQQKLQQQQQQQQQQQKQQQLLSASSMTVGIGASERQEAAGPSSGFFPGSTNSSSSDSSSRSKEIGCGLSNKEGAARTESGALGDSCSLADRQKQQQQRESLLLPLHPAEQQQQQQQQHGVAPAAQGSPRSCPKTNACPLMGPNSSSSSSSNTSSTTTTPKNCSSSSSSNSAMCMESSVFSWLPVSRSPSLLSLLHHQQLLAHAPYQTRDTGMAYRERDTSSVSLIDLVVKKRPAGAPRHQRRPGGGGRSCASSSSSSSGAGQRASASSTKDDAAAAAPGGATGTVAEDEGGDEAPFNPLVNKKWGGQPLPPVSLHPPPDGAVLSLLIPSGVTAADFPAAIDTCTDVQDVLRLLAAVAAAQQQQQQQQRGGWVAAAAGSTAAAAGSCEGAVPVKTETDHQQPQQEDDDEETAAAAAAGGTDQRRLPLPQILSGPTAVWVSPPPPVAAAIPLGTAAGGRDTTCTATAAAAGDSTPATAAAAAAANSGSEEADMQLPLYAGRYMDTLDSRRRALLSSRIEQSQRAQPQEQQQQQMDGTRHLVAAAAVAAEDLPLPPRPPYVLPPLLRYFGAQEAPSQQQQQMMIVSPVPPAAAAASPEEATRRTGVPLALGYCRERGLLVPLQGLEELQQQMQRVETPAVAAAAAPNGAEPQQGGDLTDKQPQQQQGLQQRQQQQQQQQLSEGLDVPAAPEPPTAEGVIETAETAATAGDASAGGGLAPLWMDGDCPTHHHADPLPMPQLQQQQQQLQLEEEEQSPLAHLLQQERQQRRLQQQQQQRGPHHFDHLMQQQQPHEDQQQQQQQPVQQQQQQQQQPQQQDQQQEQPLCAVGGHDSLEAEAENLAWRLVRLAQEKRHLLDGLLVSIASEERPALQEWAKAEEKMVQHYIKQSAAHALDTRHTYTLADQTLDILRLRVSCSSSSRLPPEWAERALCTVCGSGEDWDEDPIIFCDGCYIPTHFLCLGGRAGGFDAAVAAVAAKRRRRAREAGGEGGLSPAATAARAAAAAGAAAGTGDSSSRNREGAAGRPNGAPSGPGGRRTSSNSSSSAAAGEERRPVGGAGGFAAGQNEEEEWLCPICEYLRKQLPLLDEEVALAAIRLSASPRTATEADACKAARHSNWGQENFAAFTRWSPPKLLGLQQGDGRKPRGYNHRRAALAPPHNGSGIPSVRVDKSAAAVAAAAAPTAGALAGVAGGEKALAAHAPIGAAGVTAQKLLAETKTTAGDDPLPASSSSSSSNGSSCSSSAVNPLAYLRQVPFCFSDSEDEELVCSDAAAAAQQPRGGSNNKNAGLQLQQQHQQEEEPVQTSKFYSKDPKMRCIVEVSPVPGLIVTLRLPVCCLCGYDAFCPGGGPMRKTDKPKVWAHVRCALAVNGLVADETVRVVVEENRARLRCLLCHHWGPAPTQCAQQNCPRPFHLPCATASHSLQTDWDQGRPIVFCHPHSKDRAPTLILRRYQANREKEKVKARALDLPVEIDLSKRRLSLCSADLLFPSYPQTTDALFALLADEVLQQQLRPRCKETEGQGKEEPEGQTPTGDAKAATPAAYTPTAAAASAPRRDAATETPSAARTAAVAAAENEEGDSEAEVATPARRDRGAATPRPSCESVVSEGDGTPEVQQQQQEKRQKSLRGKQQQQQVRAGPRASRGSAGGAAEGRLSVSPLDGPCSTETAAATEAAGAAEEEEILDIKEVGDPGEAARVAACLLDAGMPPFLCDEKTFCCLFSSLGPSTGGQGDSPRAPTTFAGMREGQGLYARSCLLEALALLLVSLGVHAEETNRETLQQLAAFVRLLSVEDAAEAAAGSAAVAAATGSPTAEAVKASNSNSSNSSSSSKSAPAAAGKPGATSSVSSRKALTLDEGRQGELRPSVASRLAGLNKSPFCCLCGRTGLASQQQQQQQQQQHGDQQHCSSEPLQRCTLCHVKICRSCWGSVERQPSGVSLGNDAAARAVRLQRRRAWRDAGGGGSKLATGGPGAGGDDPSGPCDEALMDSWVCPRCEALVSGSLPSLAASRCLLCSRIDGLLLRRHQEPRPSGSSRTPHPTDPAEGEVQWVHCLCAEGLVPPRFAALPTESLRSISRAAFDRPCCYCGQTQGATVTCSSNGNGSRCSYAFHVSCARMLGCRMEGHHGASHKVQCIYHSLQGPQKTSGAPQKAPGVRGIETRPAVVRGGTPRQSDPLYHLASNPIDYLQHHFIPGILLTGLPHSKPYRIAAVAPATPQSPPPTAPAPAPSRGRPSGDGEEEKQQPEGGRSGTSSKARGGKGPHLPDGGTLNLSDEESDSGTQTPAPPSPMHLAEQRELLQLSRVVATEALRKRGGDSNFYHAMELVCGPLETLPPAGTPSEAAWGSPETKRRMQLIEENGEGTPQKQQKRKREGEPAVSLDISFSSTPTEGAAATPGKVPTVRMPEPPPPKIAASAAMFSAQWYGGICCAGLPPSSQDAAQEPQGTTGAPTTPQDSQGPAALPVGQPGQVEGETKPVFCPICNGLYKELPGGGPGDGLHWIGCDCCLQWYHWLCSGYTDDNPPPADEDWYCYFCATRIRASLEQKNREKAQGKAARQQPSKKPNTKVARR